MDELRRREAFAEELGGPERVKRQHDGGRLHDPRADRQARRPRQLPRDRQDRRHARLRRATTTSWSCTPSNFVFGRARVDGRPVVVGGDDFTVRGGSADATIKGKHNQCERMAHDLRLPLIRIVEGSGGGGSVKTIETTGRANVPGVDGWEWVVDNMGTIPRVALGLGLGGRPRRRAPRRRALLGDGEGPLGAVRGRPAGGRAPRPEAHQERARRLGDPAQGRRRRRCGRHRGGRLRARAALPLLHAVVDRRPAAARAADDDPAAPRPVALRGDPARIRASRTRCARSWRRWSTSGSFFEVAPLYGRSVITGLRAARRLAGGGDGERSVLLRRRVDGGHLPEGRALRRHRADLPPARRLPRRLPRLPHRPRGRADGHDQAGRARDVGHVADDDAVVRGDRAQLVRRGRRRPPQRQRATACATRGRRGAGARCRSRAASRPRTAPTSTRRPIPRPRWRRSRSGCNKLRSPFRSAETFWIEEIVDPRDTRPLLCEFANLAAPLRTPGPSGARDAAVASPAPTDLTSPSSSQEAT